MTRRPLTLLSILILGSACGDMYSLSGDMGITQGGVQDINLAREIIAAGRIPDQSQFRSEGLFSEHDLPLTGEECELTLCPRASASRIVADDGSGEALLVHIGFGSDIDPDTYERRPLNLAVAVDISGSMSGMKMDATKDALLTLVDQLSERDTLSIVAFDDKVDVISKPKTMDSSGRSAMKRKIERLDTDGGTDIESGLEETFEQAEKNAGQSGIEDRVMLFTDAQPNVGATGLRSFMGLTRAYAEEGIGLSVFGVGLDLGAELATEISTVRGANSFYLADQEEIEEVFTEDFAFIVSPIAYNLEVQIEAAEGFSIDEGYGVALDSPGTELEFGASTLFLSRKNGGMGAVLRHESGSIPEDIEGILGQISVSFERADDSGSVEKETTLSFDGGESYTLSIAEQQVYGADQLGVYRMAALVDEYNALTAAAEFCDCAFSPDADCIMGVEEAKARVDMAAERLAGAAIEIEDDDLMIEAELMQKLRENLENPDCESGS
jgi:Ca-activated chloride channel family protein